LRCPFSLAKLVDDADELFETLFEGEEQ